MGQPQAEKYHPLLIAICTLGKVRIEWVAAWTAQSAPFGRGLNSFVVMDKPVAEARNAAIQEARGLNAEYLMFWDDDVIPRWPTALEHMVATLNTNDEIDVLGGVYPIRRDVAHPIVAKNETSEGPWWGWKDGKCHQVYMVGTGFMIIRLDRFADIDEELFKDDALMSDDYHFADLCKRYGKKQFVDGSVICDQIDLDSKLYRVEDGMGAEMAAEVAEVGLPPKRRFEGHMMPGGLTVKNVETGAARVI